MKINEKSIKLTFMLELARYLILDTGYWMLDIGYWILDTACWILDTGCWMLDKIRIASFYNPQLATSNP